MKKIISLFSVIAMICTMLTTVAFADDNNKFYIEKAADGTNVTLTFYMKTNQTITSASGTLDATAALAACDSVSFEKKDATTFTVNTTQKVIAWTLADTAGVTGTIELGSVTFTNVKSTFSLPLKRAYVAKDDTKTSVVSSFTNEQVGYEVTAPEEEEDKIEVAALEDGGNMYGMKTKVAKVTIPAGKTATKAVVSDGTTSKNYDLPSGVKGGAAEFIAIIRYAADLVNPAFTLKVE